MAAFNSGPHGAQLAGRFKQPLTAGMLSLVFASEQPICEREVYKNQQQPYGTLDQQLGVLTSSMIATPFYFAGQLRGVISCVRLKTSGFLGARFAGLFGCEHWRGRTDGAGALETYRSPVVDDRIRMGKLVMKTDLWITPEQAWAYLERGTGRGIRVAVLDSGIEVSHPKLAGIRLRDDVVVTGDGVSLSFVSCRGLDVFGHGRQWRALFAASRGSRGRKHPRAWGAIEVADRGYPRRRPGGDPSWLPDLELQSRLRRHGAGLAIQGLDR